MNELPSTEFRKRFAGLTGPTLVTANGHPIGVWTPVLISWKEADGAVEIASQSGRLAPPPSYGHAFGKTRPAPKPSQRPL